MEGEQGIVSWIVENDLGDIASVIGLLVSLIGFGLTAWLVWRSKTAAEAAREAANGAQDAIVRSSTIADFSAAITTMNEIKRFHRISAWHILPDRYAELRRILISIRGANPELPFAHKSVIQGAIQHLSTMEAEVEKAILLKSDPPDPAKLNKIISKQVDKLSEILEQVKRDIGD